MHIKYNDVGKQWDIIEASCFGKIKNFLQSGNYMNEDIKYEFEQKFIETLFPSKNVQAVGVSNGTSALRIALECLELQGSTCVVMPTNTFVSNAMVCSQLGYEIKLLDFTCSYQMNTLELEDFLKRSRDSYRNIVIMAVHLTGLPCDLDIIKSLSEKYGCYIIEDCSQATGTIYKGHVPVGVTGDIATFSCYPTKNLGAAGEAGVIVSKTPEYISKARAKTQNGSFTPGNPQRASILGNNDRIDALQCIILTEKLKHLKEWNQQKQKVAGWYEKRINSSIVEVPLRSDYSSYHTYHTYTGLLRNRKKDSITNYELKNLLEELGIETKINYKPFIHSVPYYKHLKRKFQYADLVQDYIINLPMHPFLTEEEVDYVCDIIKKCLTK